WRKVLTRQINVGAKVDDASKAPTQQHAYSAAEEPHNTSLGEEKFHDVRIAAADGLHDSNLAAALEDGHHQSVDDAERGHRQRQAAEDSKKQIEDGEEALQAAGGIENRKSIEAEFLDGVLQ